jgi:hypothetical protein
MKTNLLLTIAFFIAPHFISAQPVLDWHKSYNGGSNFTDKIVDIAVDNNCNTIVVGQSDSIGTGIDIVTIKYDLNGNVIWSHRYDGTDHLDDVPTDLTVDQSGNIYVCGRTQSATQGFNYVTIKFTPSGTIASGNWPAIYNNNNSIGNGYDGAKSLAVNSTSGEVYVTGESYNHYSISSHEDVFNIKYDSQGNIQDTVSGVNTTGGDFASQIGIDNVGHLFVSAFSPSGYITTYDYNATLTQTGQWDNIGGAVDFPTEFGIDQSNYKYIGFDEADGFDLVKISTTFTQWQNQFHRTPTSVDHVKSLVTDNSGTSYVAASTQGSTGESDLWLLKVDTNGDTLWTKTWGGANGNNDVPVKILLANNPTSIVVVGNSTTSSNVLSVVLLRFDLSGNLLANYPVSFNTTTTTAVDAVRDNNGNFFIGGFEGGTGSEDFTTLKYKTINYSVSVSSVNEDSLYVTPAAASYQWYKDGVILPGQTHQGINVDTTIYGNGSYFCEITQYCNTYYSDTVQDSTVGINPIHIEGELFNVSVTTENQIEIHFNKAIHNGTLIICDVQGRVVHQIHLNSTTAGEHLILSTNGESFYFLKLYSPNTSVSMKIPMLRY